MSVLVGRKAPLFSAKAVINGNEIVKDFSLGNFIGDKHILLLFYPKDFTFVCPTELHAFQDRLAEFEERNVQIIAISTDTEYSHWGWLQQSKKEGGIKGVTYPLVADTNKTIAINYGVLAGEYEYNEAGEMEATNEMIAYRGLFLIDKSGVVKHQLVNDNGLGRSVDEALRMVDALQFFEENGEVCPANWSKGKEAIKSTREGLTAYLESN